MSNDEPEKNTSKILAILIPFILYAIVVIAGKSFTGYGLTFWYKDIIKPSSMPDGGFISSSWTIVLILCTVSFSSFLARSRQVPLLWAVLGLYFLNAIFHCGWTCLFFLHHLPGLAAVFSFLSGASLIVIMLYTWSSSRVSSLLLLPCLLWVCFATYFSYAIYRLNA